MMNVSASPYLFDQSRKRARYVIGGEPHTAKSALKKFPRLVGLLQPSGRIKTKSVEDKFRRWIKSGKFKSSDFSIDAPEFREHKVGINGTFCDYICDDPIIGSYDVPALFDFLGEEIKKTMRENLGTKVYLNLRARIRKLNDGKEETHTFYSGEFKVLRGATPGDIEEVIRKMEAKISELLEKMEMAVGSGWAFLRNEDLKLRFAEFKPMGSSYVELPEWIKNKYAVINVLNTTDNECLKWCITRSMNPIKKNQNLIRKKLREQSELFDWTGVSFPTTFEDVGRFEANNVSVNVLGCDEETKEIIHLRNGNGRYKHAVTLLLFEGHYCLVRNVSPLASRQLRDGITYFCDFCSFSNSVKSKVMEHQESCTGEVFEPERVFPEAGSVVKFKNFERCVESPFVIYAVFESCLEPTYEDRGERTTLENQHIPIGYSYYLVSRVDPRDNKLEHYTTRFQGEDVALHFLRSLRDTVLDLFMKYRVSREMCLSCLEEQSFKNSTHCWVCGKQFTLIDQVACNDPPVRDHCHYTGRYRGAAHNSCNLLFVCQIPW